MLFKDEMIWRPGWSPPGGEGESCRASIRQVDVVQLLLQVELPAVKLRCQLSHHGCRAHTVLLRDHTATQEPCRPAEREGRPSE